MDRIVGAGNWILPDILDFAGFPAFRKVVFRLSDLILKYPSIGTSKRFMNS